MTAGDVARQLGLKEFLGVCTYFDLKFNRSLLLRPVGFRVLRVERTPEQVLCTCRGPRNSVEVLGWKPGEFA